MQSRVALPAVTKFVHLYTQTKRYQTEVAIRLIYRSLVPLVFAPPGHCCMSVAFRSVVAHVMFHRESRPEGQPPNAEGFNFYYIHMCCPNQAANPNLDSFVVLWVTAIYIYSSHHLGATTSGFACTSLSFGPLSAWPCTAQPFHPHACCIILTCLRNVPASSLCV